VTVCKESGFLAAGGCLASTIILPQGTAPTSICPLHGGTWAAANSDPNIPRLLLSPRDEEVIGIPANMARIYSISISDMTAFLPADEPIQEPLSQGTVSPYAPATPASPNATTLERTPQEIEQRYQNLLKEYDISD